MQEPTDYTMRTEKITPKGLKIGPELIHQGVGEDTMLDCFHYDFYSQEEAVQEWKITPEVLDSSEQHTLRTLFNKKHTSCFALSELLLEGEYTIKSNGGFYVVVIYSGEGALLCNGQAYPYTQGDEIFISAAIPAIKFKATRSSKILLCYPPS